MEEKRLSLLFFFLPNTCFQNSFVGETVCHLLSQKHEWDEAEKIAYCSSLPHFFLPSIQEVVSEVILPNTFSKLA